MHAAEALLMHVAEEREVLRVSRDLLLEEDAVSAKWPPAHLQPAWCTGLPGLPFSRLWPPLAGRVKLNAHGVRLHAIAVAPHLQGRRLLSLSMERSTVVSAILDGFSSPCHHRHSGQASDTYRWSGLSLDEAV